MKMTNLNLEELNKRADEVFDLMDNDYVHNVIVDDLGKTKIEMTENGTPLDYYPEMKDRPQALAYLLGERNDFND